MILQIVRGRNVDAQSLMTLFMMGSLSEVYAALVKRFREHKIRGLHFPDGKVIDGEYKMNGTYTRRRVIYDVYLDSQNQWHIVEYENFKVQLIECKGENGEENNHALLFDLLDPYESYTLRAIFFYVMLFTNSTISIENFCTEHHLPVNSFKRWLKWIRTNGPRVLGTGNPYINTKKHLSKEMIRNFCKLFQSHFAKTYKRVINHFNTSVFQTRATPAQSVKLCGCLLL